MQTKKKERRELLFVRKLLMINSRTYLNCYILMCSYEFMILVIGVIYSPTKSKRKNIEKEKRREKQKKHKTVAICIFFTLELIYNIRIKYELKKKVMFLNFHLNISLFF